jgi:hypothetical protein
MAEHEVVWPWGMTDRDPDPRSRPWVFNPHGFMVAVLEDADEADRAEAGLREAGFSGSHLRTYPGQQVLEDRERLLEEQGVLRRAVGHWTSDSKAVELFLGYARDGRAFLWVYVPEREDAKRAVRALSTRNVLYIRHYGDDSLEDLHMG